MEDVLAKRGLAGGAATTIDVIVLNGINGVVGVYGVWTARIANDVLGLKLEV